LEQSKLTLLFMSLLAMALASGCSSVHFTEVSEVNDSNGLIQADQNRPRATVYFIRPKTEHVAGYADNVLDVELDGEGLMELAKTEYTLVYLKPRDVTITLRNRTQARGRWDVTEMARSRQFSFKAGETYFILTKMIDGEFRGVLFIPEALSQYEAKNTARFLTPVGLARDHPISDL